MRRLAAWWRGRRAPIRVDDYGRVSVPILHPGESIDVSVSVSEDGERHVVRAEVRRADGTIRDTWAPPGRDGSDHGSAP